MDHSSMTMSMPASSTIAMSMATAAAAVPSAASTKPSMSMGMGGSCKISMIWNWYTIDACFISRSWHITSTAMFAGSCIGVILLVITLELLRRMSKEYDRYILRNYQRTLADPERAEKVLHGSDSEPSSRSSSAKPSRANSFIQTQPRRFRPSVFQQMIRALLHMVQFAIAYIIMLLAMYYNGYIIICIFIGAFFGAFIFQWESVAIGEERKDEEATLCCG